ncbi:17823_t:CDS:2 [Acaulospora morrowiae]|uniref:17823_t:CDS:1 n=1 Tax=Acaulospora morrowiae TaxID=94023 RepID=A0A9N8YYU7_9GLOM|nr:17823_t:CDS:2 [Acaulospora morrowiae]
MQFEIDLLRQQVARLEVENTKLRQVIEENTKCKAENTELKAEVLKLRHDFEKLKWQTRVITSTQNMPSFVEQSHLHKTENISHSPTSLPLPDYYFDRKDNISISRRKAKPKSLEEKEEDEFLNTIHKAQVSKEIIQSIKEKKL